MRAMLIVAICAVLVAVPATAAADVPENEAPLPDAGLDQTVERGTSVALDASGSRDPDGEVVGYEWRIETPDGTTTTPACGSCARTRFTASQTGTYAVTVEVTDDDGATRSDTLYVTVEAPPEGPSLSLSGETTPTVGTSTEFDASVTPGDAPIETITWYVDGTQVAARDLGEKSDSLARTFGTTDTRTVRAVVEDENGRTASDTVTVEPRAPTPTTTPDGPPPSDGNPPSSDPPAATPSPSSQQETETTPEPPGAPPTLAIEGPTETHVGVFESFTVSGLPADATISWSTGEGGSSTGETWETPGTKTITATATVDGVTVSDTHRIDVEGASGPNTPPTVSIDDPGEFEPEEELVLTADYSDSDGHVTEIEWSPSDSVTAPAEGEVREVSITVTDDDGASASTSIMLEASEREEKVEEGVVKCYYETEPERSFRTPEGGCEAMWTDKYWSKSEIDGHWGATVGGYDVTWVKVGDNQAQTPLTQGEIDAGGAVSDDPTNDEMGVAIGAEDAPDGSNPNTTTTEPADTRFEAGMESFTKNGEVVRNDLNDDGTINVLDWNLRYDVGTDGPGRSTSSNGGQPRGALQGSTGQTIDSPVASPGTSWDSGSNDSSPSQVNDDGGSSTPGYDNADRGGTNGQTDANTDNGSVTRSSGQSTSDYREEFTARL